MTEGNSLISVHLSFQAVTSSDLPVDNVEFTVSPGDNNSMIAVGDIKHISITITFPQGDTIVNAIEVCYVFKNS